MTYDFFLAHASPYVARARELYRLLAPELNVFLDVVTLLPGDEWDREIAKALRQSAGVAILLPRSVDTAYYLRDEIATAIALHRAKPEEHRAIPVFLEGIPRDPMDIPHGLRILHAIDLRAEGGMAQVAQRLKAVAAKMRGKPLPVLPPVAPTPAAGIDAAGMHERLCKLLLSQFETFVLLSGLPTQNIPTQPAPIALRAVSVVQLLQQDRPAAWTKALEVLRKVAPGLA